LVAFSGSSVVESGKGAALISQVDRIRSQILALRYRRGEADAFRKLVAIWEKPLFYYIRRLVHTEEQAWDTLQETWLRVVRGIDKLRDLDCLASWLYRIARNTAISSLRVEIPSEPLSENEPAPANAEGSEDAWLSAADAEAIHWGLQQLPISQREVLTLFFLEDFSHRELASIVGVSIGTVKSRLHYARKALRAILEKEGYGNV